jgi:uncharacterized protein YbcC (UPF0753/DUF2309 family)
VHATATVPQLRPATQHETDRLAQLRQTIDHAAHLLPSQGPITVFVHHNTLHAYEDLPFDEGVKAGGRQFGCHAFLTEEQYRQEFERGRIRVADLEAVLLEDLDEDADRLVALFGTRYALRLAMLRHPLRTGPSAELRWVIAETDALRRFREDVERSERARMIAETRSWLLRNSGPGEPGRARPPIDVLDEVIEQFDKRPMESGSDKWWEAFVLGFLWRVCLGGVRSVTEHATGAGGRLAKPRRHRDLLLEVTGADADVLVHEVLIRFCSAFLDQGFADWELPGRDEGLYRSFLDLYAGSFASPTRWLRALRREVRRLHESGIGPLQSIDESLTLLGVAHDEQGEFIVQSLLALPGWAGMVRQMETNAEWTPHPAPPGSLVEFLAVRLILDRVAVAHVACESLSFSGRLEHVREAAAARVSEEEEEANGTDQRAFVVFQLAQVRGWKPEDLQHLSREQWVTLIREIDAFPALERRRVFHLAFERKYRNETLDGVVAHSTWRREYSRPADLAKAVPAYQVACCIDEREESFRRHLEEADPDCETFGIAGFFGVAMYYRGAADAHFKPLCPVNIKPQHYVVEEPLYSYVQAERRRAEARRRIGRATHQAHRGTRTFLGGLVTGLFGSLTAFPLVTRVLFPRTTAQFRRLLGKIVQTTGTELRLERIEPDPGSDNGHIGYSVDEMAAIVEGGLRAMGLARTEMFSPLFVICGHGSSSLNNPHEAAHDCGACGGGRGGPNARAFAQMANDPRVRHLLRERGLVIPEGTLFVGGYHNTCDDSMTWYDLDRVPIQHRTLFERARAMIDEARTRSAHERCRRFESAELWLSPDDALRHVEGRAEDLSQTRPEYGHATNALCFVGRRDWNRGLFLDRRAFLTSYDPAQDDERCSILERLLQAVIPVCAGINLEYYFSFVDPTGYGCGTKLPHNITSLLGVMDGAASDLRPGLPWQMVEIHEPVRLLFVIETTLAAMQRIIDDNEAIARLVNGDWVQLAAFDATTSQIHRHVRGRFVPYEPETHELPVVDSSIDWYGGRRDHLGYASIASDRRTASAGGTTDQK